MSPVGVGVPARRRRGPRGLRGLRGLAAALGVVGAIGVPTVASAAEPRPDLPNGATAVVVPGEVVQGGTVQFAGAGFGAGGETVTVKIDDNAIVKNDAAKSNTFAVVTSAADGTVRGSIDLSQVHPDTPLSPGVHWLRLLVTAPQRTLHATFTVVAPAAVVPGPGGAPSPSTGVLSPAPGAHVPGATVPVGTAPAAWGAATITTGPVQLRATALQRKRSAVVLKLKAGAAGSAGTVRIRTKNAYTIGRGKKVRRTIVQRHAYFVDRLSNATARLTLTADGRLLLKRKRSLKAVVELVDATGDTVRQPVVVQR